MPPKRKENPSTTAVPGKRGRGRPRKIPKVDTELDVSSQQSTENTTLSKPPAPAPAPVPTPTHPFAANEILKSLLPRSGFDYSMFHLVHPDGINHENYLAIDPEHAEWLINALFKKTEGMNPLIHGYSDHQTQAGSRTNHQLLVVETGLTTLFEALYEVAGKLDLTEGKLMGNETDKAGAGYLSPFWETVVTDPKYSNSWFHVDGRQGKGQKGQKMPVTVVGGGTKWKIPKCWTGYLRTEPPMTRARGLKATAPYLCSMSRPDPVYAYPKTRPEQVHYFPSGVPPGPGYKPISTVQTTLNLSVPSNSDALRKACLTLHSLTALILDAREYVIERPKRFLSQNIPSSNPLLLAIDQFQGYLDAAYKPWEEPIQAAFYSYHTTLFRLELPVAVGLFGDKGTTICQLKPVHVSRDTGKIVDESVMAASVSSAGSSDVEEDDDEDDDDDERLSSDTESDYACSNYAESGSAKKFGRRLGKRRV